MDVTEFSTVLSQTKSSLYRRKVSGTHIKFFSDISHLNKAITVLLHHDNQNYTAECL